MREKPLSKAHFPFGKIAKSPNKLTHTQTNLLKWSGPEVISAARKNTTVKMSENPKLCVGAQNQPCLDGNVDPFFNRLRDVGITESVVAQSS